MAVSLSLSISQNSQSVSNNTSNVTVNVTAHWTYGSWNATNQCTGTITIDGKSYDFSGMSFNTGQSQSGSEVVMTKTVNVSHNNDGSKTVACSASFVTGVGSGTITASGSKTLTTIPRKSSMSASNGTLGTVQTLTISRYSDSFTHTITYKCGDATGTVVTKTSGTSVSWTPPLSLASENTAGTSVSVVFTLTTYNGNTSIGTSTKTITCAIPASVKPTVTIAVSDPTGNLGTYGAYLQGQSQIKVVATASGSYGSTIKSYSTTADGKTYTTATATSGVISGSGTLTVKTTVTDSRGRTATASTTITVTAYTAPKITVLTAKRSDSSGNESSSGAYLAVSFSAAITSLNSKNTAAYTVKYKKSTATTYTTVTLSNYAGNYNVSNGKYVFAADSSSYDIVVTATDNFGGSERSVIGPSIKKLWSLLKKTTNGITSIVGMAINKVAELENWFDVNWNMRVRQNAVIDGTLTVGGNNISNYTCNENLLDNPTFTVNQHEKTTYTGAGYTVDRWKISAGASSELVVNDEGVTFTCTVVSNWFLQILEDVNVPRSVPLTLSFLIGGGNDNRVACQYTMNGETTTVPGNVSTSELLTLTFSVPEGATKVSVGVQNRNTITPITIKAAKLERGSVSTIAHQENGKWVLNEIPNYAEQLARCQRQLLPIRQNLYHRASFITADDIRFMLPIPVSMRAKPSIVNTNNLYVTNVTNWSTTTGFTFSAMFLSEGCLMIIATKTAHGLTDACLRTANNDVFLSAEL